MMFCHFFLSNRLRSFPFNVLEITRHLFELGQISEIGLTCLRTDITTVERAPIDFASHQKGCESLDKLTFLKRIDLNILKASS